MFYKNTWKYPSSYKGKVTAVRNLKGLEIVPFIILILAITLLF